MIVVILLVFIAAMTALWAPWGIKRIAETDRRSRMSARRGYF